MQGNYPGELILGIKMLTPLIEFYSNQVEH